MYCKSIRKPFLKPKMPHPRGEHAPSFTSLSLAFADLHIDTSKRGGPHLSLYICLHDVHIRSAYPGADM